MEQGNCLDSTLMSARQAANGTIDEPGLDAAITTLLTRSAAAAADEPALPEPGSEEAKALFRAACTETDKLSHDAVSGYPMLKRSDAQWWTRHALSRALDTGEITPSRYALLYPFAFEREHRIDAAALATNIGAYFALAYAEEFGPRPPEDAPQAVPASAGDTDLLAAEGIELADAILAYFGDGPINEGLTTDIALRERAQKVMALAGVSRPITDAEPLQISEQPIGNDDAVWHAIAAHRRVYDAFGDAGAAADRIAIGNAGGDTSDAALAPLRAAHIEASEAERQAWRDLFRVRPSTLAGLLRLLEHTAEHYDANLDMDANPDVFGSLIGAVEGLLFSTLPRSADYDLSRLSIRELQELASMASRQREALLAFEFMPACSNGPQGGNTSLGGIVAAEGERIAFLGDYAVHEIERRRPTDKNDISLRLEALVRHHLDGNGYIEPELMAEVVQAWGRA